MKRKKTSLIILLSLFCLSALQANERTEPIDILVLFDKSLSMTEEVSSVKDYVKEFIVKDIAIPGDYLLIIGFYGKRSQITEGIIQDESDKSRMLRDIERIKADGRFTDIGTAIDYLTRTAKARESNQRRKYMLLLTDGIHEPPPGSKYYSKDGSINHELLNTAQSIQRKGWKVHILSLEKDETTAQIAEKLGADLEIAKRKGSGQQGTGTDGSNQSGSRTEGQSGELEFEKDKEKFLGMIKLENTELDLRSDGKGHISLLLKSVDYKSEKEVILREIGLNLKSGERYVINQDIISTFIPAEGSQSIDYPFQLPEGLGSGEQNMEIDFVFQDEGVVFTPSRIDKTISVSLYIPVYIIVLGILGLALIAGGIIFFILWRRKREREKEIERQAKLRQQKRKN